MRKGSAEKVVRRNLTFPASFTERLEALKAKRGGASDSEVLRQAINLLEAASGKTVIIRDEATGEDKQVLVL